MAAIAVASLMLNAADTVMHLQMVPGCLPASRITSASVRAGEAGVIGAPAVPELNVP